MSHFRSTLTSVRRAPDLAAIVAQACGVLAAGIGASALLGWIAGIESLHRVSTAFIPMAPSTAAVSVILGTASFALERWPERRAARRYVGIAAVVVGAVTGLLIAQFVGGFDLGLEAALSSTTQTFLGVPVGRMSPLTACGFLLASLALVALTAYSSATPAGRRVAAGMAAGALAIGAAALAGYAMGAPLLYRSAVVPLALPTAAGLSLLGVGILTTALRGLRREAAGEEPHRAHARPTRYLPAALGTGATLLLALGAAAVVRRLDQSREQDAFQAMAQDVATSLQTALDRGLTSIRSIGVALEDDEGREPVELRGLAAASRPIGGGDFAVAWVPRVPLAERARFEAAARRDGSAGFRIRERESGGQLMAARRRGTYYPVAVVEPATAARGLVGWDAGTEPAVADAMARAATAGATAVSDGFVLVADPPARRVVFALQPLLSLWPPRPAGAPGRLLRGYVVAVFDVASLVRDADSTLQADGIDLTLREIRPGSPEPLYGHPPAAAASPFVAHAETLAVADRHWQAAFVPTAAYRALHQSWSAWALLGGGLLFALLIGAHLFGMERYASDLEAAREILHASETRFRAISETAADCIITIDATGAIVHCNAAAVREFGYEDGGLVGRNVRDIIPPTHVAAHSAGLTHYVATGQALIVGEVLELPGLHRDGREFPIEMTLSVWETGEGRFATAILRDISDRKRLRQEREQLIASLQEALANVKTLSGLMPMCAWCKKIRDDQGYWTQLETYLSAHTTAELSHGMCPECEKKFRDGEIG